MKGLSDYKGDEAIELWADLLEPISEILGDDKIAKVVKSGASKMKIAGEILKKHRKEAEEIMLRIDPEPIDGLNIIVRLMSIIVEIGNREDIRSFFGYAEQAQTDGESSTSATESTEVKEK